jgi:hypothetical protein
MKLSALAFCSLLVLATATPAAATTYNAPLTIVVPVTMRDVPASVPGYTVTTWVNCWVDRAPVYLGNPTPISAISGSSGLQFAGTVTVKVVYNAASRATTWSESSGTWIACLITFKSADAGPPFGSVPIKAADVVDTTQSTLRVRFQLP